MAGFSFNPADLQRLNRLMFLPRNSSTDAETGARRSRRAGDGAEFLDFRAYIPGDDPRKVDWSVYSRTQQLFVRVSESRRQLAVTLLVDASRSMGFGSPSKLEQAQRIACALGFVAMRGGDRVFAGAFGQRPTPIVGPLSGARGLASLVRFLSEIESSGVSDLTAAIAGVRAGRRTRGIVVVLSDFLNVPQCQQALQSLTADGGTLLAVQVLDRVDRAHGLRGKVRLRDSETGQLVDVDLDAAGLAEYLAAFESERERLEAFCRAPRRHYIRIETSENYLQAVCEAMRAKAIAR